MNDDHSARTSNELLGICERHDEAGDWEDTFTVEETRCALCKIERLTRELKESAAENVRLRAALAHNLALQELSGEPGPAPETGSHPVPVDDSELIAELQRVFNHLSIDSTDLDRDAKRALYGNLRRLYRRSEKAGDEHG